MAAGTHLKQRVFVIVQKTRRQWNHLVLCWILSYRCSSSVFVDLKSDHVQNFTLKKFLFRDLSYRSLSSEFYCLQKKWHVKRVLSRAEFWSPERSSVVLLGSIACWKVSRSRYLWTDGCFFRCEWVWGEPGYLRLSLSQHLGRLWMSLSARTTTSCRQEVMCWLAAPLFVFCLFLSFCTLHSICGAIEQCDMRGNTLGASVVKGTQGCVFSSEWSGDR